jgi:hypothetical protein
MYPFRDAVGDHMVRHPAFQTQVRRFMRIIVAVVGEVDRLSSARLGSPALVELGRKHVTMEGFMSNYFTVFVQAATSVWLQELGDVCSPEAGNAWRTLFEYIIGQLLDGYEDEMMVQKQQTQ